jgi:hypothetical protein
MHIKKIKSTKNEYVYSGETWIRNFTKPDGKYILETKMLDKSDYDLIMKNQRANHTLGLGYISEETFYFPKVVIVSDGFDFRKRHHCLSLLPDREVCIITTNRAMKKWELIGIEEARAINLHVVNNPYPEAIHDLPNKYFATCIASTRTSFNFLRNYPNIKYLYEPTPEKGFGFRHSHKYLIDDYRNPIAAAMSLAYRFGARKIALLCCDDSMKEERSGSVKLDNGLYSYPQHIRSAEILDAKAFWLNKAGIQVANYSSGPEYKNAAYINSDEEFKAFFEDEDDDE